MLYFHNRKSRVAFSLLSVLSNDLLDDMTINTAQRPRKIFVIVIITIWFSIPIIDLMGKLLLSLDHFSYRAWEQLSAQPDNIGPFKSSSVFRGKIYGDLAHMMKVSRFRQYRTQIFTTDPYGFRNTNYSDSKYYPVIVVGDSDMAGSSLSDQGTFSVQLENKLEVPVYNYAPSSPLDILADERFKDRLPRIVVWEEVERTIIGNRYLHLANLPINISVKPRKRNSQPADVPLISAYYGQNIYNEIKWYLTGLTTKNISFVEPETGMLFYKAGTTLLEYSGNQRDGTSVVKGIKRIKDIFQAKGIDLIYIPLPDKENIYRKKLPETLHPKRKQPFLPQLHLELQRNGVLSVDLYSIFNSHSDEDGFLYFLDDTHWNARGVKIAVDQTLKIIKKNEQFNEIR